MIFAPEPKGRRNFTITTKRIEWIAASGNHRALTQFVTTKKFSTSIRSKCRKCKRQLTWGDRSYEFDHKDNNNSNNSQRNCYLVCAICHRKATKIERRAEKDIFGNVTGYKTVKRKISYKKSSSKTTRKKASSPKKVAKTKKKTISRRSRT